MMAAAQGGHIGVIQLLAELNADVQATDSVMCHSRCLCDHRFHSQEFLPLVLAAQNGHVAAVRVLVELKADILRATKSGITPMISAAQNGHTNLIRALAELKADVHSDKVSFSS